MLLGKVVGIHHAHLTQQVAISYILNLVDDIFRQ